MSRRGISPGGRPRFRGIYLFLALLVACGVFAATAGAREALASRTQALRQTLAAAPSLERAISVATEWSAVTNALSGGFTTGPPASLTEDQITEITGQLHADFGHGVVTLAPTSTDWASMSSQLNQVLTTLPVTGGAPVKLEVAYR
jgi:hypothetical protein